MSLSVSRFGELRRSAAVLTDVAQQIKSFQNFLSRFPNFVAYVNEDDFRKSKTIKTNEKNQNEKTNQPTLAVVTAGNNRNRSRVRRVLWRSRRSR